MVVRPDAEFTPVSFWAEANAWERSVVTLFRLMLSRLTAP